MQNTLIFVLSALAVMVLAEGQYYVPRAYYTIDQEGHESVPIPLRRLRRSFNPYPFYPSSSRADANANANANAYSGGGGSASANANANAYSSGGGWGVPPSGAYGSSNPNLLSVEQTKRQSGPVLGHSVSASSSVSLDSTGRGYYDQQTSVN